MPNPFALDLSALNQGMTDVGKSLGRNAYRQTYSDALQELVNGGGITDPAQLLQHAARYGQAGLHAAQDYNTMQTAGLTQKMTAATIAEKEAMSGYYKKRGEYLASRPVGLPGAYDILNDPDSSPEEKQQAIETIKLSKPVRPAPAKGFAPTKDGGVINKDTGDVTPDAATQAIRESNKKFIQDHPETVGLGKNTPTAFPISQEIKEGATAINRKTGQRMILKGGKWVIAEAF